jgi:hypothetical protein
MGIITVFLFFFGGRIVSYVPHRFTHVFFILFFITPTKPSRAALPDEKDDSASGGFASPAAKIPAGSGGLR